MYFKLLPSILLIILFSLSARTVIGQNEQLKNDTLISLTDSISSDSIQAVEKKSTSMVDSIIHYPAKDSIIIDVIENKIYLYNEAKVTYGDIELSAYYIELDLSKKELFATGWESGDSIIQKPVYKQGDDEYEAKTIRYNFETTQAFIEYLVTPQSEGILHSEKTKKDSLGNFYLEDGKFTTCDSDHPHYYFALTKAKLTPDRQVIAGPAYLVIADIPFPIGIPFGFFPKTKKHSSGLLFPSFGEERNRGFYMQKLGWYFAFNNSALSDRMDLSIVGDIYSKGSWRGNISSNYSKRYKYRGNVQLTFARNVMGEKELPETYSKSKDFKVIWSHNQDAKAHPYRTFSAQVNFSTSKFDKYNSYQAADHMRTTKSSSVSYRRKWDNPLFNFQAKLGHTQNSVDTTVTLQLPSAGFTIGRIFPFRKKNRSGEIKWYEQISINYTSRLENKIHVHEDSLFNENVFDNLQNGFQHDIPLSASFKILKSITFTPSVKYQGNMFFNYIEKSWIPAEDSLSEGELVSDRINGLKYLHNISPGMSLGWNKKIYGEYTSKRPDSKFYKLRHVMTPNIGVSYRPNLSSEDIWYYKTVQRNEEEDMLEYSIFENSQYRPATGQAGGGSISFSLQHNLEMKVRVPNDTIKEFEKVKLLDNLNFSTNWDMIRDSLNLNPIRMTGRTKLFQNVNLNFGGTFDPYVIDDSTGRKLNKFEIAENNRLWRMTSANISCGFQLPFKKRAGQGGQSGSPSGRSGSPVIQQDPYVSYTYFNVPWQLNIDYSLRYTKPGHVDKITQSLRFSGFFRITPKWNFTFNSGYDFVAKDFTYTTVNITRDLHCWEMSFQWIPFGTLQSYSFRLNVKNQLFKDLEVKKRKSWYDI